MCSSTDMPNISYPYNSRTTTALLADTLCRRGHTSPCSSELWGRNSALACDLSPVTVTDEDNKSVYTSYWLCSQKNCIFRYTLLIPGKINILRDDVLSMSALFSVKSFPAPVQLLKFTAMLLRVDGKELPTVRRKAVPSPLA
jgi:hypothetical protein